MQLPIYAMIYIGSALMVYNVYSYVRYEQRLQQMENWGSEKNILYVPIVLLVLFLIGYLLVGFFGKPDWIVSGILFGGSIFVFIIFRLIQRITNRIQENERLEARLMAAQETGRLKNLFLSSVSHEMRTPMNAIIGLDTLALRNPGIPPETRAQLEKIDISARHLLGLIENVLDISRMETGDMTLQSEPFTLHDALTPVDTIVQTECATKGLQYTSTVTGEADARCVGDETKLTQMLLNLLDNAVKFTPPRGAVSLETDCRRDGSGRFALRFTVRDTGVGISEAFMPRLFEPFAQEDASSTNRYGGSGMGLSIARNIARLMGGDISVQSAKGKGSAFTVNVFMDACPDVGETSPPAEDGTGAPASEASALSGRRVLVAEDMELNAEILADLLAMEGVDSERAENGQDAVEMFSKNPPGHYDAILMDLRMPVMDGLDAARAIRALDRPDAREIPILALTANAFEEDRQNALDAGMNVHLPKPVDSEALFEALARLLGRREAKKEEGPS